MNLLIGFVVLICLFCSEIRAAEEVTDCWTRTLLVGIVSLTVPGLALFQTLIVSRRLRGVELAECQHTAVMGRISACHGAVWLTASLAIIWAVRWQDVVRGSWELDRWPLLDEALILAPVVLSLIASWAIFYDVQQSIGGMRCRRFSIESLRQRIGYVSIRFRIYLLLTLIPISVAVLSKDLAPWLDSLSNPQRIGVCLVTAIAMLTGFPSLLLLIWKNESVEDKLKSRLLKTCNEHRLYVQDIRIWKTGNRITNAVVAGFLPYLRIILLSDGLVSSFPQHELFAVVRHEAGHLKLRHLPIRLVFIILPLIVFALDEHKPHGILNSLDAYLVHLGLPTGSGVATIATAYLVYLLACIPMICRPMEFEADIYACERPRTGSQKAEFDNHLAKDMADALLRLGALAPSQFDRRSTFHPSICQRIGLINEIRESPEKVKKIKRSITRRRSMGMLAIIIVCLLASLAK